jgi:hypothetical protein
VRSFGMKDVDEASGEIVIIYQASAPETRNAPDASSKDLAGEEPVPA